MKYDVFISYRRKGGAAWAEQLKLMLRRRGYRENRVFMDTYTLRAGNYVIELEQAIRDSKNVVILVTKGCFDHLTENSNWAREILAAMKYGKNIIPVYYDNIQEIKEEDLPLCLKDFPLANAVVYSPHYVDPSYDKICSFLQKDYDYIKSIVRKVVRYVLVFTAIVMGAFWGVKTIIAAVEARRAQEIVEEPIKGLVVSEHPVLVDLGLPSGTLWLDRNIGAGHFYEYGEYYAFWETYTKTDFKKKSITDRYSAIKENLLMRKDYDVAFVKSEGQWILPTEEQFIELISVCVWTEAEYEGISGRLVTGPNGYAIFLPAAGMRVNKDLQYAGDYGYYWTGDITKGYTNDRYGREMLFAPNQSVGNGYTYCGRSVRPVGVKKSVPCGGVRKEIIL